jgi:hypothetical protein
METQNTPTAEVVESYRVTIRCKYLAPTNYRGSRIAVSRWDSPTWGKDPHRTIVGWDYALSVGENYAEAVREYVARAEWAGPWITSTTPEGAVAVWGGILAESKEVK